MIGLSPQHDTLQTKAYDFAKKHLHPYEDEWENNGTFPMESFRLATDAGYSGLLIPKSSGGQERSFLDSALIYESLARGSFAFTFALGVHNIASFGIYNSNKVDEDIVRKVSTGEKIAAIALTEPGAGSDPSAMESNAYEIDDGYVINGTKSWVTSGNEATYFIVVVKDKNEPTKTLMFLIKKSDNGFTVNDSPKKMGANFVSTSNIEFNDCFVPKDRLISENGLGDALQAINFARLFVASLAIGLTQEALDQATQYLSERSQFGQPIIKNQGIQWMLADLYSELEAVRWLTYHSASLVDQGKISAHKISMAKLRATELAMKATSECSLLLGANGYLQSYPMERYMKYAKMSQIIDGTSQIQKLIIGKNIAR